MDDLNVTVSRPLLVISPVEIKAKVDRKVYNLIGFPSMGVDFMYLYYEPETNNTRKVIANEDGQLVYEELTADEIRKIEEQLTLLNNEDYLINFLNQYEKKPEVFVPPNSLEGAPAAEPVHCVDKFNSYSGEKVLPVEGYRQVLSAPPKDVYLEAFGTSWEWDDAKQDWKVRGTYREKRKLEYLKNIDIGDQLGALFGAVQALANGQSLPADFNQITTQIQAVKNSIPKE